MKRMMTIAVALSLAGNAQANPKPIQTATATELGKVAPSLQPAAAAVDAFHAALSFLTENALIYEAGGVERGRQEYASHHLAADATFARAVPGNITRRAGEVAWNVAWIATEGRTTGTYKGKAVDRVTTETTVLRRLEREWKIVHIHWSSAARVK